MTATPLVSILMPCYGHQDFVGQSIRSLIAQDYANLELIVIDDGSPDASFERILELESECRLRFVRVHLEKKPNEGVARTLNRALALARGELVFHVASDDFVEPSLIARLVAVAVQDPRIGLVCADADFVDRDGRRIFLSAAGAPVDATTPGGATTFLGQYAGRRNDFDYRKDFGAYWTFLRGNYIPIGLLVRREAQLQSGGYDPTFRAEDYDSWLKMAKQWRFCLVDEVLAHYRWHGSNSVVRLRSAVFRDSIRLFLREQAYCETHQLGTLWRTIFRENLSTTMLVFLEQRDLDALTKLLRAARLPDARPLLGTLYYWARGRLARKSAQR